MEKVFETSYGDVKIISRYDCSNGSYYDAYDAENGIQLFCQAFAF